jgi:DNA-binding NarL/FixJ family response regulator
MRRRYYMGPTIQIGGTKQVVLLTQREHEAVNLLSHGYSNQGIADQMVITKKSVENMLLTLYQHIGLSPRDPKLHSRVRLALMCRGIDPDAP